MNQAEQNSGLPVAFWTWVSGAISCFMAGIILLTIGYLAFRAVGQDFAEFGQLFQDRWTLTYLWNTIGMSIAVTLLAALIAVPAALLTTLTDLRFRGFWILISVFPLAIPSYVGAFAFISAFGPRGSFVQNILEPIGVQELPSIYGWPGAIMVLSIFTFPYIYLTTAASLRGLDLRQEEAARSLGSSHWRTFWWITMPRILPGVGAGGLLVGLYALSDFGAVSLLQFNSFTNRIYIAQTDTFNTQRAAFYSLILIGLTVLLLWGESYLRDSGEGSRTQEKQESDRNLITLGYWQWPAQGFLSIIGLLGVVLPLGISMYWMIRGVQLGEEIAALGEPLMNSVGVSLGTAVLGLIVAIPIASFSLEDSWIGSVFERVTYVGYAIPGVVLGLALMYLGIRLVPFLYQTLPLLLLAYLVRFIPQAVSTIRNRLEQLNPRFFEAGISLGRKRSGVFREVVLPLLKPGLFSGFALVFLTTMKELPATLLLAPTGFQTLATRIWQTTHNAFFVRAGIHSLALIVITSIIMVVLIYSENRIGSGGMSA